MIGKNLGENSILYGKSGSRLGKHNTEIHKQKQSIAISGSKHPKYDSTLYCWENTETKIVYEMTRYDFSKAFCVAPSNICLLLKNNRKSVKGFRLVTK